MDGMVNCVVNIVFRRGHRPSWEGEVWVNICFV